MPKTAAKKAKITDKNLEKGKTTAFDSMVDDPKDNPKSTVKRTEDAGTWQERFDIAYKNEKAMKEKWSEWYEMMYAVKTYKNIAMWKSQAFIPVMSYKAWTIIAKLLALRPGFAVRMYDELYSDEDRKYIEKANLKLEYDYDNPMLEESIRDKEHDIFTDATVCGTGFGKAEWVSGTKTFYNHFQRENGEIDYSKAEKTEVDYGYNDLEPLNAFDVYGSPGKRNWEQKPWIIVKYRKTRGELLEDDMYDEAMVNKLVVMGGAARDPITKYKQSRDQFIGSNNDDQDSIDDTVDSFDVYECYEKTPDGVFLMTFAEASGETDANAARVVKKKKSGTGSEGSWFEIRNEKQPYWHKKYPIVPAYIRRKPHHCYGESIFEVTESMSNAYNDIFNQLADNLAVVGNGGILMHETSTTIYDFYYAPGGEVRYSGTKPEFETPKSPDMQMFTTMFNLLDSGITNATVSPYASGTPNDQNDSTQGTASGINALQEAAGEITSFMKGSIMQFIKGVGVRWLSNNRQFLDEAITIPQTKYGKKQIYRITGQDFLETMVLTIDEDSMQPVTKQQQREDNAAWVSSLTALQDRSLMQSGLIPNPAVPTPQPTIDPMTQQPVAPAAPAMPTGVKPMYLDYQKIAAEVNESFNKPDIEEFLLDTEDPGTETSDNSPLIEAVRALVTEGALDGDEAQAIIDSMENRVPTSSPKISLNEGDEYAQESTTPTIDDATDTAAALGLLDQSATTPVAP